MFFLSKLLGQPVRDASGKPVGTLLDLVVSSRQKYPRVTALVVKRRGKRVLAPWDAVASFEESGSLLRGGAPTSPIGRSPTTSCCSSDKFLDKQLVDTDGRKVIRVNDIQLMRAGANLNVVAVDMSSGAILRRVGLARVSDRLTKSSRNPRPTLIDWRNVNLEGSDESSVRLTVPRTDLSLLHPADIADIAHELTPEERAAVFDELEHDLAADALEEMHPSYQASLLLDLPDDKASELLNDMSPDDAADLLADLPEERAQRLISLMEKEDAEDVRELLTYPEHSAGGIMTTDYAWVGLEATAGEALQMLRTQAEDVETVYYIYVLDQERAPARRVLAARAAHRARDAQGARLHGEQAGPVLTDRRRGRGHRADRQVQPPGPARRRRAERPARHHHRRRRHRSGPAARVEEAPAADLPLR